MVRGATAFLQPLETPGPPGGPLVSLTTAPLDGPLDQA